MPTARKLPSGSWRCQVFSHYEDVKQADGTTKKKRIYESFTCDDPTSAGKREAERLATQWASDKDRHSHSTRLMLFGDALANYIGERSKVLSPASIRKYKSMANNCMKPFEKYRLKDLTQDVVQAEINNASGKMSPKTIRDMHGLLTAVLARFYPETVLRTTMPKKVHTDMYIPSDDEIKLLIAAVKGTDMEIPVYLAAFGALRRGEIAALDYADISDNIIHVHKTMVLGPDNKWVIKAPKSYAGDRYVALPRFVIEKMGNGTGRITNLRPNMITSDFSHILKKAGLPPFRFHSLRHYNVSISHALGIPDAYIMQFGGWGNDRTLKEVYRHTMKNTINLTSNIVVSHFEKIMQHEMQHEKQKSP